MNLAVLMGRLTKDPEQRTTSSGHAVTSFTVAIDRRFKTQDGQKQSDFINCVAWRQTAEFVGKYFTKGMKIGVVGTIQTRTYDDANGVRRYVTEIVVDNAEFVESKRDGNHTGQDKHGTGDLFAEELSDFEPMDYAELPF